MKNNQYIDYWNFHGKLVDGSIVSKAFGLHTFFISMSVSVCGCMAEFIFNDN